MTLTYFNDINVYFHMKNHYKMLKQVKSVIDTSLPQSLLKSPLAMHSLQKRLKANTNEQLRKIYNSPIYKPQRGGQVKRHNCLNSAVKSESSLKTSSLQSRPNTRRNLLIGSPKETLPIRSCSVGPLTKTEKMFKFRQKKRPSVPSTRSSSNAENQNFNLQLDLEKNNSKGTSESSQQSTRRSAGKTSSNIESPEKSPIATDNTFLKESSEEHKYLLFLLRITEDIIVNDYYSNSDIKQVFRFHIEANKQRLNVRKMQFHIGNLCEELCIDCKEYRNEHIDKYDEAPPFKFKNSQTRSCYLTNEAFLNCHDCSTIRTSSLYRLTSLHDEDAERKVGMSVPQNGNTNSSITPSLLRLLEKLSLGRVTECTEPIGSTSTMNSPNCGMPYALGATESKICTMENPSMDFDVFVKELNSKEDNFVLQNQNAADKNLNLLQEFVAVDTPSVEIYNTLLDDNPQENVLELIENKSSRILPPNFLSALKLDSSENSKSEISEKYTSNSYDFEYEKSTPSDGTLRGDKAEKNDEEVKVKQDEAAHEKTPETIPSATNIIFGGMPDDKLEAAEENAGKGTIAEDNQPSASVLSSVVPVQMLQGDKTSSNGLLIDDSHELQVNVTSNVNPTDHLEQEDRKETPNEILHNQKHVSDLSMKTRTPSKDPFKSIEAEKDEQANAQHTFTTSLETPQNRVSLNLQELEIDSGKCSDSLDNQESERQESILKVILQGSLNESDYVMIKGPVYVYKPLLDSEPKLVVFSDETNPKLRRNSADSQHSNRTFTVSNGYVCEQLDANQQVDKSLLQDNVDEAIQFDQDLHSLPEDSMENILELTRLAYSQLNDMKLLQSDYDLTPQKDSDHKYHHLMVDATSSVSGVNIPESLLLTDDYLVKSEDIRQDVHEKQEVSNAPVTVEGDYQNVNDIDRYLKFESNPFDSHYIHGRNTKVITSASMPKLATKSITSGDTSYETLDGTGRNRSGEMLLGYGSDFSNFDLPSRDSSLRSEGETYKNADKMKGRFPWSSYCQ